MQAVLYTQQLEPITVVRLHPELWRLLLRGDRVRLPVQRPLDLKEFSLPFKPLVLIVDIWGERIRRRGEEALMLFCADEELALALKSDLLPGQRKDQQADQRLQFARGFFYALSLDPDSR